MFHVKQAPIVKEVLLTYAELAEDDVENVLDVHTPEQPSQRVRRQSKFFRRQFLALPDHRDTASKRSRRLLQEFPLPGSADQSALGAAKIVLGEIDQCRDQLRHAVAAARRNLEASLPRRHCL